MKLNIGLKAPYGILYFKVKRNDGMTNVISMLCHMVEIKRCEKYMFDWDSFKMFIKFLSDPHYEIIMVSPNMQDMYYSREDLNNNLKLMIK